MMRSPDLGRFFLAFENHSGAGLLTAVAPLFERIPWIELFVPQLFTSCLVL